MKTGIFGGSFNPPHNGHIYIAEKAKEILKLDRIFVIPAGNPPHKKVFGKVSDTDRLNMAKEAFGKLGGFFVLDIEIKKNTTSYTFETFSELKKEYPSDAFFLLVGYDMFITLKDWYNAKGLFENTVITAASRNDDEKEKMQITAKYYKDNFNAKTEILDIKPKVISSTEVRQKIADGRDFSMDVPKEVYQYIFNKGLYR